MRAQLLDDQLIVFGLEEITWEFPKKECLRMYPSKTIICSAGHSERDGPIL